MKFLDVEYHPGFTIYRNGPGPVWVCPHSGPALEVPTARDHSSDTIASQCWLKMGGTLILSSLSRKRMLGMDYNRESPDQESSLNAWNDFVEDRHRAKLHRYRKKYAWTSFSAADHRQRSRIYGEFWRRVSRSGRVIIFIHSSFTRAKNFPSVIDVITYQGRGIKKDVMEEIVGKANKKYERFFRHISAPYRKEIVLEQRRIIDRIKEVFSDFDLERLKAEFRGNLEEDMDVIKKYSERGKYKKMKKDFNERNFMSAVRSAMGTKELPRITVESVFQGSKALRMKRPLFREGNVVMEIEATRFLGYWYPRKASDMLTDIVKDVVSVDMYKKMGAKQRQIMEYLRSA